MWTNTGAVNITDAANATVGDGGSSNIISLTATIQGFQNGGVLSANTSGTPISASYNASTRTLTLSNTATAAQYQQVLRTIKYNNTVGGPGVGSFIINFVANDGTVNSTTAVGTVASWFRRGSTSTATRWRRQQLSPRPGATWRGQHRRSVRGHRVRRPGCQPGLDDRHAGQSGRERRALGHRCRRHLGQLRRDQRHLEDDRQCHPANYQTVLRSVKYNNSSGPVNLTSKTVNFVGYDATGQQPHGGGHRSRSSRCGSISTATWHWAPATTPSGRMPER